MLKKVLYCAFSIGLFFSKLPAQQHIRFERLGVEDGLSQSSVTCIFQDAKGFMWFGTQDGLNRFDGYSFKVFKNDPSDSTSLSENFIFAIMENERDELIIKTQGGTYHRYRPQTESFTIIEEGEINFPGAKISSVGAELYESSGIVWKGGLGSGTGLIRTDTKTGKSVTYKHDPLSEASLSDDKVYSVYRDRKGSLWVSTFNGLDRFDEESGEFVHYRHDPDNPYSLPRNWVWPVLEDSKGNVWIGTVKGGLCRFDRKTGKFTRFQHDPNDPTSLSDNFIFSIYEDRSGLLWIGTNHGGINILNPATQRFQHFKQKPGTTNSLSDNNILSILVDRKGKVWLGTSEGGINIFDPENQQFSNSKNNQLLFGKLVDTPVQTLFEDRSGAIWFGSYSSGLVMYDPVSGKTEQFRYEKTKENTLSDNRIYALTEDNAGNIWVGTYGGGLNKIVRNTGKIFSYQTDDSSATFISSNATWALDFDGEGRLWIGTFGGGLNVFDEETQTFQHFKSNPDDSTAIIDNNIIRVYCDKQGIIWLGTTKGLSKYHKKHGTFINYTEKDGLANSFVYGIVEDNDGHLWLSTNNGLSRFNPETELFRNYYYKNGLQGNEFNQNAFAKDLRTGKLLFGGTNGLTIFHPDSLLENTYVPPVEFTGFTRYNTDDEEGMPIVEKGITHRDYIPLSYKDNIIVLEFAALSFLNISENQYRYKLEGFNENWIQLGHKHSVTFTNLSPGEYNLNVHGSNNEGVWSVEGATIKIEVSPPWWKTNIAYGMFITVFFSLLYGIRRYEISRREQKAQIRESALRLKATEAEKRALEIENERKTKEFEEARQLQLSMLPEELPDYPGLSIAAYMRTATEVGGDYYDFIVDEEGTLNIAFGDATGHGLQAGTMVTLMKGLFTSDAWRMGLSEFMDHCTKMIKEIKLGRILMSFSFLRIKDNRLEMISGGMPPLLIHNRKTGEVEEILIEGMPLGAMLKAKHRAFERELSRGDTLLLFTDGLPEQMNDNEQMFDYNRVKEHFKQTISRSPDDIIKNLVEAADAWMGQKNQDDDMTFVIIKVL